MDNASTSSSRERAVGTNRVNLKFVKRVDLEYFNRGILVRLVRLIAQVSFRIGDIWSTGDDAILEQFTKKTAVLTGSPISVIPRSNWQNSDHSLLSLSEYPVSLAGVTTTAQFGLVTIRVHDGVNISHPLRLKAHLLSEDTHPLILGFEDFLTEVSLYSHFPTNMAYLEFSES